MQAISKREADAHDRVIEAAMQLTDLLEARGIETDEYDLEKLTFFLAANSPVIKTILAKCTMMFD
ncbi:MAG: YebG family protein [Thermodesulfobacteriota bacterium]